MIALMVVFERQVSSSKHTAGTAYRVVQTHTHCSLHPPPTPTPTTQHNNTTNTRARQQPTHHPEVVVAPRPVQAVEPVPAVVGVPVQALGPQKVVPRVEERHPLRQRHQRQREAAHARAGFRREGGGRLDGHLVEERLVVVAGYVGDVLLGVGAVGEGLV